MTLQLQLQNLLPANLLLRAIIHLPSNPLMLTIFISLDVQWRSFYVRSQEVGQLKMRYIRSLAVIASEKSSRSGALTKLKALVTSSRVNGGQTESMLLHH